MTAPLVVLAGESIVCPGCGEVLLTFAEDVRGLKALRAAWKPALSGRHRLSTCRRCGSAWGTAEPTPAYVARSISTLVFPRIHLRSGNWTGWRGLGGE